MGFPTTVAEQQQIRVRGANDVGITKPQRARDALDLRAAARFVGLILRSRPHRVTMA
ncbi:MAG: hypothetical protein ACHQ4J_17245 [Candidatus Binatia bacterium]